VVAGVLLLALSALEMYRIGTASVSSGNANLAKVGIAAALGGTVSFLGGLACLRLTSPAPEDTSRETGTK
jgi:hypothetical protein